MTLTEKVQEITQRESPYNVGVQQRDYVWLFNIYYASEISGLPVSLQHGQKGPKGRDGEELLSFRP